MFDVVDGLSFPHSNAQNTPRLYPVVTFWENPIHASEPCSQKKLLYNLDETWTTSDAQFMYARLKWVASALETLPNEVAIIIQFATLVLGVSPLELLAPVLIRGSRTVLLPLTPEAPLGSRVRWREHSG